MCLCISSFLLGLALPLTVRALFRQKRLHVTVTVDADDPRPSDIVRYLSEIAARLDERPERMRVVFDAPQGIELDMESDGRMAVRVAGRSTRRLDLRRRWIADHPVPIALRPLRAWAPLRPLKPLTLFIDPVDANRFRVTDRLPRRTPPAAYAALALTAVAAVLFLSPELLLAVAGATLGCALSGSR